MFSRPPIAALVVLASALLLPAAAAAQLPGTAPFGEIIQYFVTTAYQQVGRTPTCADIANESAVLASKLPTTSSAFELEAERFVSTLFETQDSYNSPPPTFVETASYSARNPVTADKTQSGPFVTDLYHAFLQRQADSGGLAFWTNNLNGYIDQDPINGPARGRRAVLDAFGAIPNPDPNIVEFTQLVHSLTRCSRYSCACAVCIPGCPHGTFWDDINCECTAL